MALEAASLSTHPFTCTKLNFFNKPFSSVSLKFPFCSNPIKKPSPFHLQAAVEQETLVLVKKYVNSDKKRKLFVLNLPWSLSVVDIKKLFGECGHVADVEIIKQKNGNNRGFAFVAMASGEEAQAAIDKFNNLEMAGRKISVQFAKRFKKPRPSNPASPPVEETRHRLYVWNLASKEDQLVMDLCPLQQRRKLNLQYQSIYEGKELLGRQMKLKFSDKYNDYSKTDEEFGEQPSEDS